MKNRVLFLIALVALAISASGFGGCVYHHSKIKSNEVAVSNPAGGLMMVPAKPLELTAEEKAENEEHTKKMTIFLAIGLGGFFVAEMARKMLNPPQF